LVALNFSRAGEKIIQLEHPWFGSIYCYSDLCQVAERDSGEVKILWRRRLIPTKIFFIIIILAILSAFILIERSLRSTIEAVAEAEANWSAVQAINTAVLEKVASNVRYADLVQLEKDINNRIVFMQINMILVNKIKSDAQLHIQQSLKQLERHQFRIPFGQVFGTKLLASHGPAIKLNLMPVGVVNIDVVDSFAEAGINQTRHRIYLQVESKVKVIVPLLSSEIPVKTQIPIADAIIVGPVPHFYLEGSLIK
jgi:sporulation protein YunB